MLIAVEFAIFLLKSCVHQKIFILDPLVAQCTFHLLQQL